VVVAGAGTGAVAVGRRRKCDLRALRAIKTAASFFCNCDIRYMLDNMVLSRLLVRRIKVGVYKIGSLRNYVNTFSELARAMTSAQLHRQ